MKAQELYEKVFGNMPMGETPSLPFIHSASEGQREIAWFYYDLTEEGKEFQMDVIQVATANENLEVSIRDTELHLQKEFHECLAPEIELAEYYSQFVSLYESYNEVLMKALLRNAVPEPLLEAYEKVSDYLANENGEREILPEEKNMDLSEVENLVLNAMKKQD